MSVYVILDSQEVTQEMLDASEYTRASDMPVSLDKSQCMLRFAGTADFPLALHTRDIKVYNQTDILPIIHSPAWEMQLPE